MLACVLRASQAHRRYTAGMSVASVVILPVAATNEPAHLLVLKGYHMGSMWFTEAFNRMSGCYFHFEFERCLRKLGWRFDRNASTVPSTPTLQFFERGCGCPDSCGGCVDAQQPSSSSPPRSAPCRVIGVSFGAIGLPYLAHLRGVVQQDPRIVIVAHVRSNYIKQALSTLRSGCEGVENHVFSSDAAVRPTPPRLRVPPTLLLFKARGAARENAKVLADARSLSGHRLAYVIQYEAMQLDLDGEMRRLLRAIGVPDGIAARQRRALTANAVNGTDTVAARSADTAAPWPPSESVGAEGTLLVKAGSESAEGALVNFGEVERYLRPVECLHRMLLATTPMLFDHGQCVRALDALPPPLLRDLAQLQETAHTYGDRAVLQLNASECGRLPAPPHVHDHHGR